MINCCALAMGKNSGAFVFSLHFFAPLFLSRKKVEITYNKETP